MSTKSKAAAVSVVSNTLLTAAKIAVALVSGSVSVLSEAVHSFGDVIASALAFVSVRFSDRPADEEHPYGHGKVESFAGMSEALLLLAAAIYVAVEAISRLSKPEPIKVDVALGVVAATAVVNVFVGRYLTRVSKETDSEALKADAAHVNADFVTSAGVLLALLLVRFTGQPIFDPILALALAVWIVYTSVRIAMASFSALIDVRLPDEEVVTIENILRAHPEVLDWHALRTRKSGSHRHIDGHILLKDDLSLIRAHEITEEVEDKIRQALPNVSITLHMEPHYHEIRHREEEHRD